MSDFAYSGKRVLGSRMGSTDFARDVPRLAAAYLTENLVLDELISRRFPLDAINEAIESARAGTGMRHVIVDEGVPQ
jgi:S-(hydroxymethyl)glutathione dehydrogenase/alcohol dehydrogenase